MPPQVALFFAKYGTKLAIGAGILVLLAAGIVVAKHFIDKSFETAETAGAAKAENAGHEVTLDQLGKAHEAEGKVRAGAGSAKYDECVRSAAPGFEGNCDRYKPVVVVPGR